MAVARTGTAHLEGGGPRSTFRTGVGAILTASLLPAALVTGCAGNDDETLPAIDQRSSSGADDPNSAGRPSRTDRSGGSVSAAAPAPEGADLAPDELAAYDKAVTDVDDWAHTAQQLKSDPVVDQESYDAVRRSTFDPYTRQFLGKLQRFEQNDIEVRGRMELYWRVPVRVNLDARWPTMVWKECAGDGTIRVFNHGEQVEQQDRTPFSSRLTLRVDSRGTWRPISSEDTGPCGA